MQQRGMHRYIRGARSFFSPSLVHPSSFAIAQNPRAGIEYRNRALKARELIATPGRGKRH